MVKQVLFHETDKGSRMPRVDTQILIQVESAHPGEVDLPRLVHPDQLFIHPDGRVSGRQAQHGIGLGLDYLSDDLRRQTIPLFSGTGYVQLHLN